MSFCVNYRKISFSAALSAGPNPLRFFLKHLKFLSYSDAETCGFATCRRRPHAHGFVQRAVAPLKSHDCLWRNKIVVALWRCKAVTVMALPSSDIATTGSFFLFSSLSSSCTFVTRDEAIFFFCWDYAALDEKDACRKSKFTPAVFLFFLRFIFKSLTVDKHFWCKKNSPSLSRYLKLIASQYVGHPWF